jgi:hypothetical protein
MTGFSSSAAHAAVTSHYFYIVCASENCTAYDCISFNQATSELVVIGESGAKRKLIVPGLLPYGLRFAEVPWDTDTNLPANINKTIQPQWLFVYTRFFDRFLSSIFGGLFTFFLIVALQVLSAIGRNKYRGLWTIILMPLVLIFIGIAGPVGDRADLIAEQKSSQVVANRTNDGHILPMPANVIEASNPAASDLYASEEVFAIAHILFFWLLIRAYRGAHYLLVPHPVERLFAQGRASVNDIVAAMGQQADPGNPPPEYKSQNWRRRLEELTKRTDAETELLRSSIKNKRERANWEE